MRPDAPTRFTPGAETQRELRQTLGLFATGVTVVTVPGPVGITANSFASVSLDPPLVLWSPARGSQRFPAFARAERFAIHVLGEDQAPLCEAFARDGSPFDEIDWTASDADVPLIPGCLARFECRHHAHHDGGDHLIVVGHVEAVERREGAPLIFSAGRYGRFARPD